ncbi:hypothetical protein, conserved [Angomonas deanei]|uniref:Uncharacterized protein n=1 Tax=Angomonas deanei TaxID=59799 RepID=A0A7G2CT26_9TRYP|nr:hypothetical protein, conserved [Angomonas deanei]
MAAVEMIDALRDGTKKVVAPVEHTAPSNSQSPPWQDLLQSQLEKARYVRECHDSQLDELHQTEHQLRQSLMATHTTLEAVSQKAKRREEKWRELCAALHAAEQTVFALLECQEESGAEALLQQRDRYYETVDRLTVDLLQDAEVNLSTSSQPPHSGGELCLSLKTRLDNAVRERNEYLETIESLQETIRQLSHASAAPEVSVKHILQQQKKYEEGEVTDYESASKRYDHKNNNTSSGELHTISPPRKNLSALLAEATSPYDSLLY